MWEYPHGQWPPCLTATLSALRSRNSSSHASQTKPSQSANRRRRLAQSSRRRPRLLAILVFDHIAGSITDTLPLTGEYVYAKNFKVRLGVLTDLAKDQRLGDPGLILGGIKFVSLAVWILSPDWLS
jgi:hypothetical protein